MKGLILTGGKGTRLRPITHTFAKQLIPIANKPVLFYGIEALVAAGITNIGFVVGDTKSEIKRAIGDGSAWGIQPTFIEQDAPSGLAHAVKIAQDFIKNDNFIMYLGDNLVLSGITKFVRQFERTKPNAQILLAKVACPRQFGVAQINGSQVIRLEEKPQNPRSDLALVGVYLFDKTIFQAVNAIQPSSRGELEITDAIQYLIDHRRRVDHTIVEGWWKDTGKLEDILEANRIVLDTMQSSSRGSCDAASKLEGKVIIEEGAHIARSTIRGPVVIGKNTIIEDSYIGPFTAVYHDVIIKQSEIEHSIILEYSRISDIHRLADSLIGQNVEIIKSETKPKAYRIMVGDSSKIEIV